MTDKSRWADLESRLAFQEDHIHQLTLTVNRQQRVLDALLREMQGLRRQLLAVAPQPANPPDDEGPPPHY